MKIAVDHVRRDIQFIFPGIFSGKDIVKITENRYMEGLKDEKFRVMSWRFSF